MLRAQRFALAQWIQAPRTVAPWLSGWHGSRCARGMLLGLLVLFGFVVGAPLEVFALVVLVLIIDEALAAGDDRDGHGG
jgi:hypothetical protein